MPAGHFCSIAHVDLDLLGEQIDLRFSNKDQGSLAIVVAPILRFIDVGFNADVRIEEVGPPEKLISGFAPELFGAPLSVRKSCNHFLIWLCCCVSDDLDHKLCTRCAGGRCHGTDNHEKEQSDVLQMVSSACC